MYINQLVHHYFYILKQYQSNNIHFVYFYLKLMVYIFSKDLYWQYLLDVFNLTEFQEDVRFDGIKIILNNYQQVIGKMHFDIWLSLENKFKTFCIAPIIFDQHFNFKTDNSTHGTLEYFFRKKQHLFEDYNINSNVSLLIYNFNTYKIIIITLILFIFFMCYCHLTCVFNLRCKFCTLFICFFKFLQIHLNIFQILTDNN